MPKLYELTDEYAGLVAMLEDCQTDEEVDSVMKQIDAVTDDIAAKGEAYARIRMNLKARAAEFEAQAKIFKAESDRLTAKAKSATNECKRLEEYLLFAMGVAGMEQLRTGIGLFYTQKTTRVDVLDAWAVPKEFTTPQEPKVDKDAIKRAHLQTGELFPGVEVVQTTGIRFR